MVETSPVISRPGAKALERGLDLLERIVDEPMDLHELADQSGLALLTTQRLVSSLVDRGFLSISQNRRFRIGPKLLELGARGRDQLSLVVVARPYLQELSAQTGAPSFLGERYGDKSVHLHRESGSQRVMVSTSVGTQRKLPETSLGQALLLGDSEEEWDRLFADAAPESRREGWAEAMRAARAAGHVVLESVNTDRTRAVAAPVRDASGEIVAAISVVSAIQYAGDSETERFVALVGDAAEAISGQLGYRARAA